MKADGPTREGPHGTEHRLVPADGLSWIALLPPGADTLHRELYALLEAGMLELWQTEDGTIYATDADGDERVTVGSPRPAPWFTDAPGTSVDAVAENP